MAESAKPRVSHVSGPIKSSKNKDGSVTFKVGSKKGVQRFTLSPVNQHFARLAHARRVLVRFQVDGKNPTILLVLEEPSGRLVSQYTSGMA